MPGFPATRIGAAPGSFAFRDAIRPCCKARGAQRGISIQTGAVCICIRRAPHPAARVVLGRALAYVECALTVFPALKGKGFFSKRETFLPESRNRGPTPLIEYQRRHSRRYRKPGRTDTGMPNGLAFRWPLDGCRRSWFCAPAVPASGFQTAQSRQRGSAPLSVAGFSSRKGPMTVTFSASLHVDRLAGRRGPPAARRRGRDGLPGSAAVGPRTTTRPPAGAFDFGAMTDDVSSERIKPVARPGALRHGAAGPAQTQVGACGAPHEARRRVQGLPTDRDRPHGKTAETTSEPGRSGGAEPCDSACG